MELSINDRENILGLLAQIDGEVDDSDNFATVWEVINEVIEYAYNTGYNRGFDDGDNDYDYGTSL